MRDRRMISMNHGHRTQVANCHLRRCTDPRTVGWNWMKLTRSVCTQQSLSLELRSEWVSERTKERSRARERMSGRCERSSERRSEWPSTLRVNFIVVLPTVALAELCEARAGLLKDHFWLVADRQTSGQINRGIELTDWWIERPMEIQYVNA